MMFIFCVVRERFGDGFDNGGEVAHRHHLAQQVLQHALHAADGNLRRNRLADQLLLRLAEIVEQFLRLGVREQFGHVVFDDFGQDAW